MASYIDDFAQTGGIKHQIRSRQRGKVPHLESMPCGSKIWAHGCQAYFSSRFGAGFFWKGVIKDIESLVRVE